MHVPGTTTFVLLLLLVMIPSNRFSTLKVEAGEYHNIALTTGGEVFVWYD